MAFGSIGPEPKSSFRASTTLRLMSTVVLETALVSVT